MTFDQIPIRMLQLGVDRQWLADQCDYSLSTLANVLAPNGDPKSKTQKALRRIWEALDREEVRQKSAKLRPEMELQQLVLRPTDEQFENWCRAAGGQPLNLWAVEILNQQAEQLLASINLRSKADQYRGVTKMIPHLAAAAGPGIEAEVIETVDSIIRVKICGLSMDPLLADGQVIAMHSRIASRSPFMKKGLIYLVRLDDGTYTVKRYGTRKATPEEAGEEWAAKGRVGLLESINPAFAPITIKGEIQWLAWLDPKEIR